LKEFLRRHLATIGKVAVTVAGLAFVFSQVELATVGRLLLDAHLGWLLFTFFLVNISLVIRAYRWFLLLQGLSVTVPFQRLVALYFVGNFFNAFLPTSFGGDVMRIVEVTRDVPAGIAAGTVIVDRLTGLLMLFVMALAALPFRPANFPAELLQLVVVVSIVGLVGGAVLLEGSVIRRFGGWLPGKLSPVGEGPVARILKAVNATGWRAITGAMAVSLVFNLVLTTWWWSAGRALGFDIPFTFFLLVVPILSISLLVPAIGGFGPREAVATILFDGTVVAPGAAALADGTGFALSALVYLLQRLSGVVGGVIYLWMTLRRDSPVQGVESQITLDETGSISPREESENEQTSRT
jgi:uncharacterized protein (TIRG00374 family)